MASCLILLGHFYDGSNATIFLVLFPFVFIFTHHICYIFLFTVISKNQPTTLLFLSTYFGIPLFLKYGLSLFISIHPLLFLSANTHRLIRNMFTMICEETGFS